MITARSSVVHLPPGHYDKIMQVIRRMVNDHHGIKKGTGKYRCPPKRARPDWPRRKYHPRKSLRRTDERIRVMEEKDPDGLLELWNR